MKALWITDLHLRPGRHEAGARLLAFILKIAKERAPEIIVCTGDVFHDKNFLYATSLDLFRDFLVQAGKFVDQIYLAPGNHDYGTEYSVHSLTGYKGIPRVTVVDTVAKITEDVGIVSYARQEARFNQLMHELGPVKFLFGHFDLNGFDLGSGWEEKESWSDPEIFKKIPTLSKVFSGHYHLAQSKIVNDITFTYLGTGATTDFGESDQIKRIGLVDLSTGVLEEIQTGLTLHKTLRINAGEDFPDIPTAETEAGVEYRLIIRGTQQQIDLIACWVDDGAKNN